MSEKNQPRKIDFTLTEKLTQGFEELAKGSGVVAQIAAGVLETSNEANGTNNEGGENDTNSSSSS